MPKRLIDDSLLTSPSLAKCSPKAQDAFPRFILLADDFGCFEAFPRVLRAKGWPYRDDVSEADVWAFLEQYVAAGMACVWTEGERRWCYLTGWDGPHGQKKRVEYDPKSVTGAKGSKRRTPRPPEALVVAVVAGTVRAIDGKPPGVDRETPDEIPSLSVPARELAVSRREPGNSPADSRPFPAPAVPVPVADEVPLTDQALASLAPREVTPFVAFLRDTYPDIRNPWKSEAAWLKAYPRVDLLAEALKAHAWETAQPSRAKKNHGAFLNRWFANATPAPPPPPAPPAPPSLDASFLARIGSSREQAEAEWLELAARVKRSAYPDALPQLWAEAREQFQATWQEEATA